MSNCKIFNTPAARGRDGGGELCDFCPCLGDDVELTEPLSRPAALGRGVRHCLQHTKSSPEHQQLQNQEIPDSLTESGLLGRNGSWKPLRYRASIFTPEEEN